MLLKVEHRTLFEYDSPIYETATEVRLHPASGENAPQRCTTFELEVEPAAELFEYTDFYGNRVHHFNLMQSHQRVSIMATSIVETAMARNTASPDQEESRLFDFLTQSRYVHKDAAIEAFTADLPERATDQELAAAICGKINETFTYEPGVTDVHSTSSVVMALGRGVCQDFAHIMLAACRSKNIPARYISGYLYGGGSTPEGQDEASHAWCEVYCGRETGWIGMDPTHRTLFTDERYITIGSGRDYADVPPVRGTWKGMAEEKLSVSVRITAVE